MFVKENVGNKIIIFHCQKSKVSSLKTMFYKSSLLEGKGCITHASTATISTFIQKWYSHAVTAKNVVITNHNCFLSVKETIFISMCYMAYPRNATWRNRVIITQYLERLWRMFTLFFDSMRIFFNTCLFYFDIWDLLKENFVWLIDLLRDKILKIHFQVVLFHFVQKHKKRI